MSPNCYQGNCSSYGPQRAYDGVTAPTPLIAISEYARNPYMQFDLGVERTITSLVVVSNPNCCVWQSADISVSVSATQAFSGGTLCTSGLAFTALGESKTVLCRSRGRYVTLQKITTAEQIALAEVTIYGGGTLSMCCKCACMFCPNF